MHRALSIAEIVEEILSYLDDRILALLARTASVFELPAYRRLYHTARVGCLHSLFTRIDDASGDTVRDATSRSRCLAQAKLVRNLDVGSSLISYTGAQAIRLRWSDVHAAVNLLRRPLYPFPCLRVLDLSVDDYKTLSFMDALLCPTLEELNVAVWLEDPEALPTWEARMFGMLEGLAEKASRLKKLDVFLDHGHTGWRADFDCRLADVLGSACRRLPLIELITEPLPVTPQLLLGIASLDNLESIGLCTWPDINVSLDSSNYRLFSETVTGFRALRTAHLRGGDLLGEIVRSLKDADLQILYLEIMKWGPHMSSLMEAASDFGRTLTDLEIFQHFDSRMLEEEFRTHTIPRVIFTCIASCSRLQTFRFNFYPCNPLVELHNSDIELLARSWPMLKVLELHCGWKGHSSIEDVHVNAAAFVPLSLYCSFLSEVTIHPLSPTLDVPLPPALPSHPWKRLTIGFPSSFERDLSDDDAVTLTHYLDSLWPDVFLDISGVLHFEPGGETCSAMNNILAAARKARTMRTGTRWRARTDAGRTCQVSGMPEFHYFSPEFSDACPWEIIS